jgi:DNA-directed RNA polymerase specialized sigma24 family protein
MNLNKIEFQIEWNKKSDKYYKMVYELADYILGRMGVYPYDNSYQDFIQEILIKVYEREEFYDVKKGTAWSFTFHHIYLSVLALFRQERRQWKYRTEELTEWAPAPWKYWPEYYLGTIRDEFPHEPRRPLFKRGKYTGQSRQAIRRKLGLRVHKRQT